MSSTSASSASSTTLQALDESRGSSVSTELREEYEDLLRYAVVVPAKSMMGGGPLKISETMVSRTAMVSNASQLPAASERISVSTRAHQPPPSPLTPEGKLKI